MCVGIQNIFEYDLLQEIKKYIYWKTLMKSFHIQGVISLTIFVLLHLRLSFMPVFPK